MQPILEIQNLSISFTTRAGQLKAVRGLDLTLEQGKTLALVGESGSGKSVTARAIMGSVSPNQRTGGSIVYRSREKEYSILEMKKRQVIAQLCGKHIAMVFQDPQNCLNPTMPIGKQVMEGMLHHTKISRAEAKAKTLALLEEVGIPQPEQRMKQYPHQLSGGMRQRVVLAIALSCQPELLICDEPTTALDVTTQAKVLDLIARVQQQRKLSVLYITHDLAVVAGVADFVAVMYAGRIVEQGTAEEIFYHPQHPYTWGLLDSVPDFAASGRRLYSIPGSPPNPLTEIQGDAFAPRNPYALAIDYQQAPPRFQLSPTHFVSSWLADPRAPKITRRSKEVEDHGAGNPAESDQTAAPL